MTRLSLAWGRIVHGIVRGVFFNSVTQKRVPRGLPVLEESPNNGVSLRHLKAIKESFEGFKFNEVTSFKFLQIVFVSKHIQGFHSVLISVLCFHPFIFVDRHTAVYYIVVQIVGNCEE